MRNVINGTEAGGRGNQEWMVHVRWKSTARLPNAYGKVRRGHLHILLHGVGRFVSSGPMLATWGDIRWEGG